MTNTPKIIPLEPTLYMSQAGAIELLEPVNSADKALKVAERVWRAMWNVAPIDETFKRRGAFGMFCDIIADQEAELKQFRDAILEFIAKCNECDSSGVSRLTATENAPCGTCTDLRALLKPETPEDVVASLMQRFLRQIPAPKHPTGKQPLTVMVHAGSISIEAPIAPLQELLNSTALVSLQRVREAIAKMDLSGGAELCDIFRDAVLDKIEDEIGSLNGGTPNAG